MRRISPGGGVIDLLRRPGLMICNAIDISSTMGSVAMPDKALCWCFCVCLNEMVNRASRLLVAHSRSSARARPWLARFQKVCVMRIKLKTLTDSTFNKSEFESRNLCTDLTMRSCLFLHPLHCPAFMRRLY